MILKIRNKKASMSAMYALIAVIIFLMLSPLYSSPFSIFFKNTRSDVSDFNDAVKTISEFKSGEGRKIVLDLSEETTVFFINKDASELKVNDAIVKKSMKCDGRGCICICQDGSVEDGKFICGDNKMFCEPLAYDEFKTDIEHVESFVGGVMLTRNMIGSTVYVSRDGESLGICKSSCVVSEIGHPTIGGVKGVNLNSKPDKIESDIINQDIENKNSGVSGETVGIGGLS